MPNKPATAGIKTGSISFPQVSLPSDNGIHCNAQSSLVLYENGDFGFSGDFRNTDFVPYDISLAWVVSSRSGVALTFRMKAKISNANPFGHAATHNWGINGNNPNLAQHWNDLVDADRIGMCEAAVKFNLDSLIDSIVKEINRDYWIIEDIIDICEC
jgi:hypothetical protein